MKGDNMARRYKQANGTGGVVRLSGKRRKPWAIRITKGWKAIESEGLTRYKQEYAYLGYYETSTAAYAALAEYNRDPYDPAIRKKTLQEVYDEWSTGHYSTIVERTANNYRDRFNSFPDKFKSMPIMDIRTVHIENVLNNMPGNGAQHTAQSVLSMVFNFAMRREYIQKDYYKLSRPNKLPAPPRKRKVFNDKELKIAFELPDLWGEVIKVALYSGMRPGEIIKIKTENVHLEEGYFIGGIKTTAGKDRIVPIHKEVFDIFKKRVTLDHSYLFTNPSTNNRPLSYDVYLEKFNSFFLEHTPHHTRHTFISRWKELQLNDHVLKLIVGHSEEDLTERVYTHRTIEQLQEEMDKFNY